MGLYFISIDLGFCSWFLILVFAQWFCSRLGRTFRVTEKVLLRVTAKVCGIVRGHGKILYSCQESWHKTWRVLRSRQKVVQKSHLTSITSCSVKALKYLKKLRKRIVNPDRPQTFAVTPKYITTRYGYTGDKSQFLPLEAAKRRLVFKKGRTIVQHHIPCYINCVLTI